jgi:hypothetical protein
MRGHHSGFDLFVAGGRLADELAAGAVRFTITNGQVTGLERVFGDWTVDTGLYHLTREVRSFDTASTTSPTYGFTVSNGAVTAVTQTFGTSGWTHDIDVAKLAASAFAVAGNTVTETTIRGNTLETLQFTTTDGVPRRERRRHLHGRRARHGDDGGHRRTAGADVGADRRLALIRIGT